MQYPSYTWQELACHNTADSLWVGVRGQVFDLTHFARRHPGGKDILLACAGRDATQLFETYHGEDKKLILKKFVVGKLVTNELPTYPTPSNFWLTLKGRVDDYFKKTGRDPRVHPLAIPRYTLILLMCILGWNLTYKASLPFWGRVIVGAATGMAQAQIGLTILHDASHFAITSKPWVWKLCGALYDSFTGVSHYVWTFQHTLGHHLYTNIYGADPDVSPMPIRRLSPSQPWEPTHKGQELLLLPLYGVMATMSRVTDFIEVYRSKKSGPIRINGMGTLDTLIFWGGKIVYAYHRWLLPVQFLGVKAIPLIFISDIVASYYLAYLFSVNHDTGDVAWPTPNADGTMDKDWATLQVATAMDYAHDSTFWTLFTGALNYQTAHHLLPGVNQLYYPEIAPIIMATCKEFGLKYNMKVISCPSPLILRYFLY
ncbi:hypothetical protein HDU93_001546 [Gonapodya sp. JEL0774]|nr:hypothetical protein HDU93_001546 [Gonapodya sp. JEL0774]